MRDGINRVKGSFREVTIDTERVSRPKLWPFHWPDWPDEGDAGKPAKIAIAAIMRKLVVTENALLKADRLWVKSLA